MLICHHIPLRPTSIYLVFPMFTAKLLPLQAFNNTSVNNNQNEDTYLFSFSFQHTVPEDVINLKQVILQLMSESPDASSPAARYIFKSLAFQNEIYPQGATFTPESSSRRGNFWQPQNRPTSPRKVLMHDLLTFILIIIYLQC